MSEISPELGALLWRRYYQIRAEKYGGQITVNDDTFRMLLDAAGVPRFAAIGGVVSFIVQELISP